MEIRGSRSRWRAPTATNPEGLVGPSRPFLHVPSFLLLFLYVSSCPPFLPVPIPIHSFTVPPPPLHSFTFFPVLSSFVFKWRHIENRSGVTNPLPRTSYPLKLSGEGLPSTLLPVDPGPLPNLFANRPVEFIEPQKTIGLQLLSELAQSRLALIVF